MKMKDLFGRSSTDPGQLTRVTGLPDDAVASSVQSVQAVRTVPPASDHEQSTPVPTRLQRLAAAIDRARPGRNGRNVRKWLEMIGMCLIVFGFVCIILGWYGAAHSPYLYQEVPYLISGGLLGLAVVVGGSAVADALGLLDAIDMSVTYAVPGARGPAHVPIRPWPCSAVRRRWSLT